MYIKKIFILITLFLFSINASAVTPRSTGKYKNWESFVAETDKGKICFAQTVPTKRAPAAVKRDKSKLFVTFRPSEEIKDEVSLTSGHDYKISSVTASSGKRRYSFFSQKDFAWLLDDQEEKKFIQLMKKATDIIVKARTIKGAETTLMIALVTGIEIATFVTSILDFCNARLNSVATFSAFSKSSDIFIVIYLGISGQLMYFGFPPISIIIIPLSSSHASA